MKKGVTQAMPYPFGGPIYEPKDSNFRPWSVSSLLGFLFGRMFGRLFRKR